MKFPPEFPEAGAGVLQVFRAALAASLILAGATLCAEEPPVARWWSDRAEQALAQAGVNRAEIQAALDKAPAAQRPAMTFLVENMPERDLRALTADYLLENTALALAARDDAPWGPAIPEEIFLNDVLPYASVTERRDAWRKPLRDLCAPLVADCKTPAEAAQRLNEQIFGKIKVKYSTQRSRPDQSPFESMESGLASCTGLTILLVDACRAVGVPARLAGTPNWADNRGNHTWAEIWDGGQWHFTGAAEPDKNGLDRAWFERDAGRAVKDSPEHAIYGVSFRRTETAFPLIWDRGNKDVYAENVTDRYAKTAPANGTCRVMVRVWDKRGGLRVAAKVTLADASGGALREGASSDESADANDMLSFDVPHGRAGTVFATRAGMAAAQVFRVGEDAQQVVEVYLDVAGADVGGAGAEALLSGLRGFFAAAADRQTNWTFPPEFDRALAAHPEVIRRLAWNVYCTSPAHDALKQAACVNEVGFERWRSQYTVKTVGQRPADGWPLFIAMHGGGNAPKELNDSQWKIMQIYYRDHPEAGGYLYLALRAPNDSWNGFYDDYVYPLVANLIRQSVLMRDVNPDKVFLMGYSHGGYGAFAIGPKMPDRFAAVHSSAAAPTDGETSAKTLRNLDFTYMVGSEDHAFDRVERCQAFDRKIFELRGPRTDVFPVTLQLKPGYGHGGLPDRDIIPEMYPSKRNAAPRELSWEMTDGVIRDFYWLHVDQPGKGKEINAACRDNRVSVKRQGVAAAEVLLDERLVDFSKPVAVEVDGKETVSTLQPSLLTLCQTLAARGDPNLAFSVRVRLAP